MLEGPIEPLSYKNRTLQTNIYTNSKISDSVKNYKFWIYLNNFSALLKI